MLCKDRVFERFRSLYTQRPTQGSELRRRLVFNAEVAEYARISRVASRDPNILVHEGIFERISGRTRAIGNQIIFNRSRQLALQLQGEKFLLFFDLTVNIFFCSFFKT